MCNRYQNLISCEENSKQNVQIIKSEEIFHSKSPEIPKFSTQFDTLNTTEGIDVADIYVNREYFKELEIEKQKETLQNNEENNAGEIAPM